MNRRQNKYFYLQLSGSITPKALFLVTHFLTKLSYAAAEIFYSDRLPQMGFLSFTLFSAF